MGFQKRNSKGRRRVSLYKLCKQMFQMSAEEHRLPDGKCACFYELGRMSLHSRF